MQRIVDVPAAARARGWAGSVEGSVELEVTDPANDTVERMVLEVSDGNGEVSPGGAGRIRCGIGALGAWYSSTLRAVDAARMGLMRGPDHDLRVMDSVIGDRHPWMPDHF
jgi:predicted acetyltransferase